MAGTLQAGRMTDRPVGPGGDRGEDPPAGAVLVAVRTDIGAVVTGVDPQAGDRREHVRRGNVGRVDRHPAARTRSSPANVILGERVVPQYLGEGANTGPVEQVVDGARTILVVGAEGIRGPPGTVRQTLELVACLQSALPG